MTTREWYRPLAALREVDWSMRNNTNYKETGVLTRAAVDLGSFRRLFSKISIRRADNSIEAGKKETPTAT